MKLFVQRLYDNPKFAKFLHWSKLITITGSTQILVQALGLISGLIIIRLLPIEEYALYTLANTMLGTMTVLADSGISNGVLAEGGKAWKDKKLLGRVLNTGLNLRKKFGIGSLIVTIPIFAYLFLDHGANWLSLLLIILAVIPAFFAALSDSILAIPAKLHQDIKPLQRNNAEVSIGKLILSTSLIFFFPFTYIALLAVGIPRIYGNIKLRKIASDFTDFNEKPDPLVQKEISKSVKRTLPIVIYYCISGQLSIWLISFFGSTESISHLGAMSRLAMMFSVVAVLFSTLVTPRFSRMRNLKNKILKVFLLVQGSTFLISAVLLSGVYLFSNQILWVLGDDYYGLNYELLLVAIANCLNLMVGVSSQLTISRGWYLRPYFLIGLNFLSTVFSIAFFDLSTLTGVLYFNIVVTLIHYFLMLVYGLIKIKSIKAETS